MCQARVGKGVEVNQVRAPSAAAPHAARTSSSGDLPPEDFGLRVTGAVSSTLDMIRLEDFFVNEASKVSGRCGWIVRDCAGCDDDDEAKTRKSRNGGVVFIFTETVIHCRRNC